MKILYITVSMPYGHGEEFLIIEAREILRQGHDLLISPRSPKGRVTHHDAHGMEGISIRHSLLSPCIILGAATEFMSHPLAVFRALARPLRASSLRVFLKNLSVFPKALWLARVARDWKADHIHAHWSSTTATIAMVAGTLSGVSWSFTAHRGDIAGNNLLGLKAQNASFVRFISKSGYDMARCICREQIEGTLKILHMGVNVPRCGVEPLRIVPEAPVIFCPAMLIPVKGHSYLLEALSILHGLDVRCALQLAGEGDLRGQLEELTRALKIEKQVTFLGQAPHHELLELYRDRKVDLVVLPSVDMGNYETEGIPVSLMEAMTYGIPCISTRVGGIPELFDDGAGILVPHSDPLALAEAIQLVLRDDQLRYRLSQKGYKAVSEEFNVEKIVKELTHFMSGLISPRWPLGRTIEED